MNSCTTSRCVSRVLLLCHEQSPHSIYAWILGSAIVRRDSLKVVIDMLFSGGISFSCNQPTLRLTSPLWLYYCCLNSLKMVFVQITWLRLSQSAVSYHSYGIYHYTLRILTPGGSSGDGIGQTGDFSKPCYLYIGTVYFLFFWLFPASATGGAATWWGRKNPHDTN